MGSHLARQGLVVNRKKTQRLLREMGLRSLAHGPQIMIRATGHKDYPYLLRGVEIVRREPGLGVRHHVRSDASRVSVFDGGYGLVQPVCPGVATVQQHGHGVLCCGLGGSVATRRREIYDTDQVSQFTRHAFIRRLEQESIAINMDGKGRAIDNVMIERLWRSVNYEKYLLQGIHDRSRLS